MSKKDAAVYLKAAKSVEDNQDEFSCFAIERAANHLGARTWHPATELYQYIFKPENSGAVWGNAWSTCRDKNEINECRIIALCFAAAMAEAGDL